MSDAAIFCARCGAAGQKVESYCRSCGEWLPNPTGTVGPRGRLRGLSPERKRLRIHALELLSALAAAGAAFIAFAVRAGADLDLLILSMLLCLLVVAWQGVAFFIGRSMQGRGGRDAAAGGPALPAARGETRRTLNAADTGDLVRPPSVTEGTTALLDHVPLKRGEKK